jgi:hypothetical protein
LNASRPGGAYGIRSDSAMKSGPRILPSSRHTAMGILILLSNWSGLSDDQRLETVGESVSWLLGNNSQPADLAYAREPADDDRAMTIAACIAAVSCAFTFFKKRGLVTAGNRCAATVRIAHHDLFKEFSASLWRTRYTRMQVVDNCFVLGLLDLARSAGALDELVDDAAQQHLAAKRALLAAGTPKGWPESFGKSQTSLAATISALVAVQDLPAANSVRKTADEFLLDCILNKTGRDLLTSWDWIMLARLSNLRMGSFSELESLQIEQTCSRIRELNKRNELTRIATIVLPKPARSPVLFMSSQGKPHAVPYVQIKQFYDMLPDWIRWLVSLVGAAILLVIGDKLIQISKHAIESLLK